MVRNLINERRSFWSFKQLDILDHNIIRKKIDFKKRLVDRGFVQNRLKKINYKETSKTKLFPEIFYYFSYGSQKITNMMDIYTIYQTVKEDFTVRF